MSASSISRVRPPYERRPVPRQRAEPGEAAGQPLRMPEVVLVGEGVVIGADRRVAGQREEVGREAAARPLADRHPLGPLLGAEGLEDRRGFVAPSRRR